MDRNKQKIDIDLIYLWVDGNDPKWLEKKHRITGNFDNESEINNKGRYANNDELKYSLRSVEKYIPWINNIYIVTDNQQPEWLNVNHPKIKVIDHKEIMPEEALPSFNSSVIEYFIYRIHGLNEHFLFSNDDMFFNKKLQPDYFFEEDGFPIVRLKRKLMKRYHYSIKLLLLGRLGQYKSMVVRGAKLVEEKFGVFYSGIPHHNVDAYNKSDYKYAVEVLFDEEVSRSQYSHIRKDGDLHRSAFSYYALATGKAHLKYVSRKESSRIDVRKSDYLSYLNKYNPDLFCLNDGQRVKDEDREKIKPFLEKVFPEKASFEL